MKNVTFSFALLLVIAFSTSCSNKSEDSVVLDLNESQETVEAKTLTPSFINIYDPEEVSPSENGAYYLSGTVSENCSEIWVEAKNAESGLHDNYQLSEFVKGETTFIINYNFGIKNQINTK